MTQDRDTRPSHLVQQTRAARRYAHATHATQAPTYPSAPTVDQQLHRPDAMGYSSPIFPRGAHDHPPPQSHPQAAYRASAQAPTVTSQPAPNPAMTLSPLRESRYTPHIIPHDSRQPTSTIPDHHMHTRQPSPPAVEGVNRTGRTISLASIMWSSSKPAKKRRKQD